LFFEDAVKEGDNDLPLHNAIFYYGVDFSLPACYIGAMTQLNAQKRDILGKRVRTLRAKGILPGVVYGGKDGAHSISLEAKDFLKVWKSAGESTLVDLVVEGEGKRSVLIHDVEYDPIKGMPIHVDFYEARADKPIRVHAPVVFIGEADAVKVLGGVFVKVVYELEVEALPKNLPHEITVDISKLKTFDDSVVIGDITLGGGASIVGDAGAVIAKVMAPRSEEELAGLETKEEVSLDEIEVAPKGKKEEEAEEAGEAPQE